MLLLLALTMVRASSLVPSLPGLHNYICPDYPYCFLDSSSGRWSSWKLQDVHGSVVSTRVGDTASCWLEGEHCTVEDSNTLELVAGPKDAASCQQRCGDTEGCRYFTFLRLRGLPQCFLLSQCSSAVGCPEHAGSDCQSGPRTCECATLPAPEEGLPFARWKCGDKDPYTEPVPVGASCSASCPAWGEGDARPRVLHTSCLQGGRWSLISRPSGRSAMEGEDWEGKTPDQVAIPCGCPDLGGFLYDPNEEEGTEFSCEGREEDHFQSGWWHLNTTDRCELTCNNVVAASVSCQGNEWTGEPELGFWCFARPELPGPQKSLGACSGTTPSLDDHGDSHVANALFTYNMRCGLKLTLTNWTHTRHYAKGFLRDAAGIGMATVTGCEPRKSYSFKIFQYASSWAGTNQVTVSGLGDPLVKDTTSSTSEDPTWTGEVVCDATGSVTFQFNLDYTKQEPHVHLSGLELSPKNEGWTIIQRRGQYGNPADYFSSKLWADYEEGFGDPNGEMWLGLTTIAALTSTGTWELQVELEDYQGNPYLAVYSTFKVDQDEPYRLTVSGFDSSQSNLWDALKEHSNGMAFSTSDRDNDPWEKNCAATYLGGWWYRRCHHAGPNGYNYNREDLPHTSPEYYAKGIIWKNDANVAEHDFYFSWPKVQMKIRKKED